MVNVDYEPAVVALLALLGEMDSIHTQFEAEGYCDASAASEALIGLAAEILPPDSPDRWRLCEALESVLGAVADMQLDELEAESTASDGASN